MTLDNNEVNEMIKLLIDFRDQLIMQLTPEEIPKLQALQGTITGILEKVSVSYNPLNPKEPILTLVDVTSKYPVAGSWKEKIVYTLAELNKPSRKEEIFQFMKSSGDNITKDGLAQQLWIWSKGKKNKAILAVDESTGIYLYSLKESKE